MLFLALLALIAVGQPALATTQNTVRHEARVRLFPAKGTIEINDRLVLSAQGRVTLVLDARFAIARLSVDGVTQIPIRRANTVIVDLGRAGSHRIELRESARIPAGNGIPSLSADGGIVSGNWLALPVTAGPPSRALYRITIETPPGQIAVTQGKMEREKHNPDGSSSASFTTTGITAPVLFSGPYRVAENITDGVRIRTYFYKELTSLSPAYLNDSAKYIAYYSQKIAPYPYFGFSIVAGNAPVGWGLPAMTYISRRVLARAFIRTTSLPHEILHAWWGNAVAVDEASGNWAEGLTTYQADYELAGQDDRRKKRLAWLRNYAALPRARDFALSTFTFKTSDASQVVGYGKAAFVFHMLKARLGADIFKRALSLFFTANLHRNASWRDLQSAFESVSGENLNAFFKMWVARSGAPQLELKNPRARDRTVTFTLTQTQNGTAYPLDIPVVVDTAAGTRRTIITMRHKIQSFRLVAAAPVLRLRIDPDFDVFRRLNSDQTSPILRTVTLNPMAVLFVATSDETTQNLARKLARRVMQGNVPEVPALPSSGPLIIVGTQEDVSARLKDLGVTSLPEALRAPAQAKAFVLKRGSRTVLAVMARDQGGLNIMARALAHYKNRSFVIVNAGRVTRKGTWPVNPDALTARFE